MNSFTAMTLAIGLAITCAGGPIVIQLNFTDGTDGTTSFPTHGGTTWNQMVEKSNGTPFPNIANLKDPSGIDTGISLTWIDGFHFAAGSRGEGGTTTSGTSSDGKSTYNSAGVTYNDGSRFFPWTVVDSYNATHAGSDGFAAFTFASDTALSYTFWIVASYDYNNPSETAGWVGHYNVGGTYNLASRSFIGGTTITLNATKQQGADDTPDSTGDTTLKFEIGKLIGGNATYNGTSGKYELTLQFGDGSGSTSAGVVVNAIIVEAIPEPVSVGMLLLGAALVRQCRRLRH